MTRNARLGLFGVSGVALAALLVWAFTGLPAFGTFNGEYGWILIDVAGKERHVTNVVASVVFDYRGFDTLGEEFLLYAAGRYRAYREASPQSLLELAEGTGAGAYATVGIAAVVAGSLYLQNVVQLGTKGSLNSGGTIPILNAAVGLEVAAAVVLLFHEFLEEVMYPE